MVISHYIYNNSAYFVGDGRLDTELLSCMPKLQCYIGIEPDHKLSQILEMNIKKICPQVEVGSIIFYQLLVK